MSNRACTKFTPAERGTAQGLAWTFPNKETLVPTLVGFKHSQLQANQVRVKILYFGVGNKDIQVLQSKDLDVLIPGHQIVGVIQAIGDKVGMRKIGDIVGVGFVKESCNNCKICWSGKQQLCQNSKSPYTSCHGLGGFGTHIQVSADWTFPIPKNIPLTQTAPLLYSGVTAYNIVSSEQQRLKHEFNRNLKLCILGFGAIGHMAAKFGNYFNYDVTIFSQFAEDENILKQNAIKFEAFLPLDSESVKKNYLKYDLVIVASEVPVELLKISIELCRRNGKLVFLTQSIGQVGIKGSSLVVDQKEITGVRNGTKDNFYKMLELVAHETIKNTSLLPICEHFNFTQVEKALQKVKTSTAKYQCVIKVDQDAVSKFNGNLI